MAPTLLPVTEQEVKEEIDITDDPTIDNRIRRLIQEAVDIIERDARMALMTQTWTRSFDRFPSDGFELSPGPIQSISSIKYYYNGTLTTWSSANYQTDLISFPTRIEPVFGTTWPIIDPGKLNAVIVEWIAGYASTTAVPAYVKKVVLAVVRMAFYGCEMDENSYWPMITRLRTDGFVS